MNPNLAPEQTAQAQNDLIITGRPEPLYANAQAVSSPDTQPGSTPIPTAFTEYRDAPSGTYPQAESIAEVPTPALPPIPEQFLQHPAPPPTEAPVTPQFTPAPPTEAQYAQPTVQPGPEAVPAAPPLPAPSPIQTEAPQFSTASTSTATPAERPWTAELPPAQPAPEPIAGLSPQAQTEAAVLKSMEPGNAGLLANDDEPLGVVIAKAAQAETPISKIPDTELLSNSENKNIIPAPIEEVIENGKKGLTLVEGTKLEGPFLEGFAGGVAISTGYKKAA